MGGGFVVYADEMMPGAKAVLVKVNEQNQGHDLQFLPFADGIFDMPFKPSPDFKVMEGTLCRAGCERETHSAGHAPQTRWEY